jgi:hypothetical protein
MPDVKNAQKGYSDISHQGSIVNPNELMGNQTLSAYHLI